MYEIVADHPIPDHEVEGHMHVLQNRVDNNVCIILYPKNQSELDRKREEIGTKLVSNLENNGVPISNVEWCEVSKDNHVDKFSITKNVIQQENPILDDMNIFQREDALKHGVEQYKEFNQYKFNKDQTLSENEKVALEDKLKINIDYNEKIPSFEKLEGPKIDKNDEQLKIKKGIRI